MPNARRILDLLTRDELHSLVDQHDVIVADRRQKAHLADRIEKKGLALTELLGGFSRDRLKELCRALGLDDGGREKAAILSRLAGATSNGEAAPRANGSTTTRAKTTAARGNGGAAEPIEIRAGEKLTIDALERYLWSAADILRGSIDSSDYKGFIFGLLFLKRLSDRFDEEREALAAAGDDPDDRDNHQFFVPKRARWAEIQRIATNIGEALNKACSALEGANASLEGVLAGIDFNDERKLGDARNRDVVLGRLVQHFSKVALANRNLSEPDMLGRAYEYLIEKFADDAGKKGGEFYTPKKVVELIVELLAPREGMRICDPTCGSGGMLIECAHHLARHGKNPKNLSLFGQEKNLGTWAICKMNLLLHGRLDARIEKGDTIRDPKLREGGELMLFDRVIANPPFSLDEWGREVAEQDPHGRFAYGIPPKTKGDLAFVQHMIATTNKTGMVGVVMPHGVLFRGAAEGEIRKGILQDDLVEAVVGLPANLFYGTGIPAAILVINKGKKPARKGKVLFVQASREFGTGTNQNYLRDEDVKRIAAAFHAFKDVPKYARVVGLEEIEKNDFNLNISRYVETADAAEKVDVAGAIAKLRELEGKRAEAEIKMNAYLKELGYDAEQHRSMFGSLPEDWGVMPLGQVVAKQCEPVTVDRAATYREIGIRSHGKGMFYKDPVNGESLGDKRVFWVKPNCLMFNIVFAWEGAVAVTGNEEVGMIASHRFPMFTPDACQRVAVEFLRRFFQTSLGVRLLGEASPGGAGRNRTLNQKFLGQVPVPVPPLPEQRKIAAILSSVDDAIEGTQAVIDQLQVVKKAMMAELLTRGLPGRHTRFKQTDLGEMPEDWEIRRLDKVALVFNGKASGTGGTWLRVFKTKHVYDGMIRVDKPEFARDDTATKVPPDTFLTPNDVLTPNMAHGTIGRVAFVPEVAANWTVDGQVMVLRADAIDLLGRTLFEWLSLPRGRRCLLDLEKGGAFDTLRGQTHIYPRDVREIMVPVPPMEEQSLIATLAASFDEPLAANRECLTSLRAVKHGLMDRLLTGELRVTPDEATS